MNVRLKILAEQMGHNRVQVMGAYYGSFRKKASQDASGKTSRCILDAARQLEEVLPAIPEAHLADCIKIQTELLSIDIDLSPQQVHALWARWARRNGLEWVSPEREIVLCLMSVCTGQATRSLE